MIGLRGGQGRTPESLLDDASALCWVVGLGLLALAALWVLGGI